MQNSVRHLLLPQIRRHQSTGQCSTSGLIVVAQRGILEESTVASVYGFQGIAHPAIPNCFVGYSRAIFDLIQRHVHTVEDLQSAGRGIRINRDVLHHLSITIADHHERNTGHTRVHRAAHGSRRFVATVQGFTVAKFTQINRLLTSNVESLGWGLHEGREVSHAFLDLIQFSIRQEVSGTPLVSLLQSLGCCSHFFLEDRFQNDRLHLSRLANQGGRRHGAFTNGLMNGVTHWSNQQMLHVGTKILQFNLIEGERLSIDRSIATI